MYGSSIRILYKAPERGRNHSERNDYDLNNYNFRSQNARDFNLCDYENYVRGAGEKIIKRSACNSKEKLLEMLKDVSDVFVRNTLKSELCKLVVTTLKILFM